MGDGVRAEARVVENSLDATFLVNSQEQRVAVFCYQLRPSRPVPSQGGTDHVARGGQEDVDGIVDNDGRVHRINGLKTDYARSGSSETGRRELATSL